MPLTLQVISRQKNQLGDDQTRTVGPEGATIGRSLDNDWVLPDNNRYVSSRHATIDYQAGAFYLIDTSTNGVFVNGSDTPVGAGKPQRLFNGDKISIGDYQITVEITEGENLDSIEEMIASVVLDQVVEEESDEEMPLLLEENEITGARSLNARIFGDSRQHTDTVVGTDVAAQSNILEFESNGSAARSRASSGQAARAGGVAEKIVATGVGTGIFSKPSAPPARSSKTAASKSSESTIGPGAHKLRGEAGAQLEFLRGLGISLAELGNPNTSELMHNAGQALREFIVGAMELLQTRSSLKNAFRLEQTTIQAGANNPLKFSASVDDAIRNLLVQRSKQFVPTVETVREAVRDIKLHEEAMSAATRTAFGEFADRFDPEELQSKFDASLKRGTVFGGSKKGKYWDLYAELYQVMTQRQQGQFPHVYQEEFVKAYEDYMRAAKRRRTGAASIAGEDEPFN